MKIIYYDSNIHKLLLEFLQKEYPRRDINYFIWWLKTANESLGEDLTRTFCIEQDSNIIACTLAYWSKIKIRDNVDNFYWEANTIVDPAYRGKGAGRMMYEHMGQFRDRCTTGFTDTALKIQFKVVKNLKHISSVGVYLSFTRFFVRALFERILKKDLFDEKLLSPESLQCKGIKANRVNAIDEFYAPTSGIWMNDEVEVIRDKKFINKRFFDIYRSYIIYQLYDSDHIVGYFVVRRTIYMGLNLLSLVDYRLTSKKYNKALMRLVAKVAKINRIGIIITLTSQKDFCKFFPLAIKTSKILYGGTTMEKMIDGQEFLITSADADLDFVYYR